MQTKCEIVANILIPLTRAIVAKTLIERYGLKQKEVAKLMGITQPAVSQYIRELRGRLNVINKYPEIANFAMNLAEMLVNNSINCDDFSQKLCEICKMLL